MGRRLRHCGWKYLTIGLPPTVDNNFTGLVVVSTMFSSICVVHMKKSCLYVVLHLQVYLILKLLDTSTDCWRLVFISNKTFAVYTETRGRTLTSQSQSLQRQDLSDPGERGREDVAVAPLPKQSPKPVL